MDQNPQGSGQGSDHTDGQKRRYGATRVFPRVEIGRPNEPHAEERQAPLTPEIVEPGARDDTGGWGAGSPFGGGGGGPFAPRTFGGGRVRVYGCSPGCLLISVLVSLFLTLVLNAIF